MGRSPKGGRHLSPRPVPVHNKLAVPEEVVAALVTAPAPAPVARNRAAADIKVPDKRKRKDFDTRDEFLEHSRKRRTAKEKKRQAGRVRGPRDQTGRARHSREREKQEREKQEREKQEREKRKRYHGSMTLPSGDLYEGEMVAGLPDGYGVCSSRDGILVAGDEYRGEWRAGQRTGRGEVFAFNRRRRVVTKIFDGEFRDDTRNGPGILYTDNGEVDLSVFESGEQRVVVVESGEAAGGEEVTWSADRQSAYVWCFETGADEEQKKEIALADAHAIASRLGLERWSAYKHPWL